MKTKLLLALMVIPFFALTSCSDDDDNGTPMEVSKTFTLRTIGTSGVSGTAKFIKEENDMITVELDLTGTPAGGMHPAHIHFNTAAEGGGIAVTLGTVDGDTGKSTITFDKLDDDSPITYEQLLDFDGYINVHLSASDLATIVAQGDIGQNELTDTKVSYNLTEVDIAGISGVAEFTKRANGTTLVSIALQGTPADGEHPTHIHVGSVSAPGAIAITLSSVDGDTGVSLTHVEKADDDSAITYDALLTYNGYINVHASPTDLATLAAQGNIGANAVTGN